MHRRGDPSSRACLPAGSAAADCRAGTGRPARDRVCADEPPEEQDVRLRPMCLVVRPASALLHSNRAPLLLLEKPWPTKQAEHLLRFRLGQYDMPVLEFGIVVPLGILDLVRVVRHRTETSSKGQASLDYWRLK